MYGPGITQPPPRPPGRGVVIGLRVLFAALPVLSIGFLAWTSMLRLAVLRRNPADWALMVIDIVLIITGYTLIGLAHDNTDTWQSNAGTLTVLVVMFGTPAYFLVADIRRGPGGAAGHPVPNGYPTQNPYTNGYAPAAGGMTAGIPGPHAMPQQTPVPHRTSAPHHTPVPNHPSNPGMPHPNGPGSYGTPAPVPPAPRVPEPSTGAAAVGPQAQRIDQVRAELDELSDYLRKEEGR
ncbi:hypothetical protein [Streptomyces sp. NRRL F-5123]|uniref:hypothetical protein n=1 Tax=Streptomyces sp. NRRL F-5123 TaxID=1463856 RepID=UPI0004E1859F|nr:hypothetical protein [Streptomyces sp. NRRL F-5123]